MTNPPHHTCPVCSSQLHVIPGDLVVWIIVDGRVLIETAGTRPTEKRWLELSASAQNQLAEIMRVAHETTQAQMR